MLITLKNKNHYWPWLFWHSLKTWDSTETSCWRCSLHAIKTRIWQPTTYWIIKTSLMISLNSSSSWPVVFLVSSIFFYASSCARLFVFWTIWISDILLPFTVFGNYNICKLFKHHWLEVRIVLGIDNRFYSSPIVYFSAWYCLSFFPFHFEESSKQKCSAEKMSIVSLNLCSAENMSIVSLNLCTAVFIRGILKGCVFFFGSKNI